MTSSPIALRTSAFLLSVLLLASCSSPPLRSREAILPGLRGDALVVALRQRYSPREKLSYREARQRMFAEIDNRSGGVILVYSGERFLTDRIPDHTVVNTEHTWPQSRFSGASMMKTDLHHLFPTFARINNDRSAKAFGEIPDQLTERWWAGMSPQQSIPRFDRDRFSESTATFFEPREAHKGNVARSLFYFRTIYGDENIDLPWFESQKETLLRWHQLDPADRAERLRSAEIAALQGNQNPFVLDASLAERGFGEVTSWFQLSR